MTDDESAIRQVVDAWMTASKRGDLATILTLMTDDAILMVPGQEPFGKEAFAEALKGMGNIQIEGSAEVIELQVLGPWAFIRNRIEVTVTAPGGNLLAGRDIRLASSARKLMDDGGSHATQTL